MHPLQHHKARHPFFTLTASLTLLAGLSFVPVQHAQAEELNLFVGGALGAGDGDIDYSQRRTPWSRQYEGEVDSDTTTALSGRFGYKPSEHFRLYGELGGVVWDNAAAVTITANADFLLPLADGVQLFVGGHVGTAGFSHDDADDDTDASAAFGGQVGGIVQLGDSPVTLELGYRYSKTDAESEDDDYYYNRKYTLNHLSYGYLGAYYHF
ncbi:hypothetical protein BFW38_01155 [Terasakiispira papahanaumokuakeensis]|uniref:Uncharacterized protein n=1 Tax=Terasakiispira papahanaumokuakeensis TaxID=197479 RepID=A0A1E2V615_9GAMM|nr:outer membrane beta-barrel protein [Terasakiispira papahanaumokuakeensis]ODC02353.1 hypothetical protein BFW38_01155 [Terasakiispira papahanaumokuakeensis]